MRSGRRLLTVTLSATTSRATAFITPVRPARAPTEGVISACGDVTMALVMLTIRPNPRARMPGSTPWTRSMADSMLACRAADQPSAVTSANAAGGGPALLVTRMSGSGQAASRARRPAGSSRSAATPRASTPKRVARSSAVAATVPAWRPLTTTDDPLGGQRLGAGPAEAPGGRAPPGRSGPGCRGPRQRPAAARARARSSMSAGRKKSGLDGPGSQAAMVNGSQSSRRWSACPGVVVGDLVHVREELEHAPRRVQQVPEQVRPEHVAAGPVDGGVGAARRPRPRRPDPMASKSSISRA